MKYLLLFCGASQDLEAWQALSEEERTRKREQAAQWMAEHGSQIRSHYALHLPYTITSVHFGAGGQPLVTDGPFLVLTQEVVFPLANCHAFCSLFYDG